MEADSEIVEDCFPKIFVAMVYWTIIVSGSAMLTWLESQRPRI